MKACPTCNATYEDWIEFCFTDGTPLVAPRAGGAGARPVVDAFDIPEAVNVLAAAAPAVDELDAPAARVAPLHRTPRVQAAPETVPMSVAVPQVAPIALEKLPVEAPAAPIAEPAPSTASASALDDDLDAGWTAPTPVAPPPPLAERSPPAASSGGAKGLVLGLVALLAVGGGAFAVLGGKEPPPEPNVQVAAAPAPTPEPAAEAPPAPTPAEPTPTPEPVAAAPAAEPTPEPAPAAEKPAPKADPKVAAVAASKPPPAQRGAKSTDTPRASAPVPANPSTTSDSVWGASSAATVGTLRVRSEPSGAKVYIDNAERGRTPLDVELPYGSHNVRVAQRGFKQEVRDVSVRLRELTVPFTLRPELATGTFSIYAPGGARVTIDGSPQGTAPVTVSLSEGMHTFRLDNPDGTWCNLAKKVDASNAKLSLQCP